MKKLSFTINPKIKTIYIASILLFASCDYNQNQQETQNIPEEHNNEDFDSNKLKKDAQFLVNAAEINIKEIKLGQLAQQSGSTTHVKELGKMMEDEHTKSLKKLKVLADSKEIAIPSTPTSNIQDEYKTLNQKSGKDFDKAYADMMVSGHKSAIVAFEKASTESNDADIKTWAQASLPQLNKHLEHSIECQKKCNEY